MLKRKINKKSGRPFLAAIVGLGIGGLAGFATLPLVKGKEEEGSLENKVAIVAQKTAPSYPTREPKQETKQEQEQKYQTQEKAEQKKEIYAPEKAPEFNIPSGYCSRYVRLAAEKLYGVKIVPANAWNLEDYYKTEKIDTKNLDDFADKYDLKPGTVIGVFNPKSKYNDERDSKGNKVDYTHVVLYTGKDRWGKPIFVHQLGKDIGRDTLKNLEKKGLTPKEIIYTAGKKK